MTNDNVVSFDKNKPHGIVRFHHIKSGIEETKELMNKIDEIINNYFRFYSKVTQKLEGYLYPNELKNLQALEKNMIEQVIGFTQSKSVVFNTYLEFTENYSNLDDDLKKQYEKVVNETKLFYLTFVKDMYNELSVLKSTVKDIFKKGKIRKIKQYEQLIVDIVAKSREFILDSRKFFVSPNNLLMAPEDDFKLIIENFSLAALNYVFYDSRFLTNIEIKIEDLNAEELVNDYKKLQESINYLFRKKNFKYKVVTTIDIKRFIDNGITLDHLNKVYPLAYKNMTIILSKLKEERIRQNIKIRLNLLDLLEEAIGIYLITNIFKNNDVSAFSELSVRDFEDWEEDLKKMYECVINI